MKREKLIHKKTKKSEEVPANYVPTYLANGWERPKEESKKDKGHE